MLVIVIVLGGGAWYIWMRTPVTPDDVTPPPVITQDPLNASYLVDGSTVKLVNGVAAIQDGTTTVRTAIFGTPVLGDVNGDGKADAIILLTRETGGSGTFFYVAAGLNTAHGMQGTNAILLGDRIAPQQAQIQTGTIVVNYADRAPGEPMTTPPSVGVSTYLKMNGSQLEIVSAPEQTISYLASTTTTTAYCNGDQMDSVGFQKNTHGKNGYHHS